MLEYAALIILIVMVIFVIYLVIYIHDIPYEIAKKRKHPHQDAIHTAGWVSLFLMHTIWPFLWIWATLYKPGVGWGMSSGGDEPAAAPESITELQERVSRLEEKLEAQEEVE